MQVTFSIFVSARIHPNRWQYRDVISRILWQDRTIRKLQFPSHWHILILFILSNLLAKLSFCNNSVDTLESVSS